MKIANLFQPLALITLTALTTLAYSILPSPAQAADEVDKIKATGKVRIAVFSDKVPFGYVDENGLNQGYDVYLARRIGQDLMGDEKKVEFILVEAASRIEILQAGKADIVLANFTVTPERAKQIDFAKPYMKVALGVASPKGEPIIDVTQLKGKKLIINKGSTADTYFTKNYPEVKLLKFDQNSEAFNALYDGRGVALAHDNTLLFAWTNKNTDFITGIKFMGGLDTIAPAVKKGQPKLLKWLNDEIIKLTAEGFFIKDYETTLKPTYGDTVDPKSILLEIGELK
ncbi:MAG: cysteine ABC transporter substrate-binding protein [Candidatus Adiutrix intracellularis]|jgi:polar amino acid transport system substrate-binding protein|nr:cysteine ABC transporter substrate-binding protein [Candidatus Adiutrix intracellularis]